VAISRVNILLRSTQLGHFNSTTIPGKLYIIIWNNCYDVHSIMQQFITHAAPISNFQIRLAVTQRYKCWWQKQVRCLVSSWCRYTHAIPYVTPYMIYVVHLNVLCWSPCCSLFVAAAATAPALAGPVPQHSLNPIPAVVMIVVSYKELLHPATTQPIVPPGRHKQLQL
jgi:hypothetical protein